MLPTGRQEAGETGEVIASGSSATVQLELGSHVITLRVTDDKGATAEDEVVINVADTRAPEIEFNQLINVISFPNHSLRLVAVISASDACDAAPSLEVSVSSNEPENGTGDGDTSPDWRVISTSQGTEVWVRAERAGSGTGRMYTITANAADQSGNQAVSTRRVSVPSGTLRPEAKRLRKLTYLR